VTAKGFGQWVGPKIAGMARSYAPFPAEFESRKRCARFARASLRKNPHFTRQFRPSPRPRFRAPCPACYPKPTQSAIHFKRTP